MTIYALVSGISPVRLWGLNSKQRLQRQLRAISSESAGKLDPINWLENIDKLPANSRVLLINGHFLFENRSLKGVLERPDTVLRHADGSVAAAFIDADRVAAVMDYMQGHAQHLPPGLNSLQSNDLGAFDENLRKSTKPLLEPLSVQRKAALENELYGNAYRGITDLVTKFLWPRPAKSVVHLCANMGISPNTVTAVGFVLVIAACYLFLHGYYGWGLLAGWLMTFLDTVDGKLARVTIQSSQFGHLFDHGIDLFHPPFWYIFWGMSLQAYKPVMGLDLVSLYWLIAIAYVTGRVVEGIFPLLGNCSVFTWRPYDAWFRLVTARRNPNLILLTLSVFIAKPDWGFIAVVFWSVLTSLALVIRLFYAFAIRLIQGPLTSWLTQDDVATGPHAHAFRLFGATRGAYAGK